MTARRILTILVAVAVLAPAFGCAPKATGAAQTELTVTGSTTILPIAEVAAEMFHEQHADLRVLVAGVGSSAGIESVSKGTSDIGTSSRDLKPEEAPLGLVDTPIAFDAIAVIVNPSNPVSSLTKAQVAAIFEGRISRWSEVGGPDLPIGLVNRDEASGTREAFSKIVLDKKPFDPKAAVLPGTGQVRSVVADSPTAIGYISLGFADASVKTLVIDGVAATEGTVADGTYPISRILHFFTLGQPNQLSKRYIDFVLSDAVQEGVVRDAGFIPITKGAK
ncbi:MAG: phosphate ABC transporter substrate-binding protein [Coriobacteriia bacterium]|nr:phosphate ABC transporter substrate-binding protein [Coriobacteriia bacterium]